MTIYRCWLETLSPVEVHAVFSVLASIVLSCCAQDHKVYTSGKLLGQKTKKASQLYDRDTTTATNRVASCSNPTPYKFVFF